MTFRVLAAAALLLCAAHPARAVTYDDIVALSKAGVTAEVLVAVIDADRSVFALTPDQILGLKEAGVPDRVVVKMLGSADEFREDPPPPLIVGAEPKARAARRRGEFPGVMTAGVLVPYPFFVGVPVFTAPLTYETPRGFGRFLNDGFVEGRGFGRFLPPR
jgi:hypothetical protein